MNSLKELERINVYDMNRTEMQSLQGGNWLLQVTYSTLGTLATFLLYDVVTSNTVKTFVKEHILHTNP